MISILWFSVDLIPRTEQSQKPTLEIGPRSHEIWELLEGDTASLCALALGWYIFQLLLPSWYHHDTWGSSASGTACFPPSLTLRCFLLV